MLLPKFHFDVIYNVFTWCFLFLCPQCLGGVFKLELFLPEEYPMAAPKVSLWLLQNPAFWFYLNIGVFALHGFIKIRIILAAIRDVELYHTNSTQCA